MTFKIIRTFTVFRGSLLSAEQVWGLANLKQLQTASAFHIDICKENKWLCHLKLLFVFLSHLANPLLN